MVFCDRNSSVLEWGSEEIVIPYRSPIDGRAHRYYVDFYIKITPKSNEVKKYLCGYINFAFFSEYEEDL